MTTYYNGYDIDWFETANASTFKIGRKKFKSLRDAMDYVDKKRARVNHHLAISDSDSRTEHVVRQPLDKRSGDRLETGKLSSLPSMCANKVNK
jgi:hypothetical protein